MTALDDYISKLERTLPNGCSARDLVDVGIYINEQSAYRDRLHKRGPEYFKFNYAVIYPKEAVIEYLKQSKGAIDVGNNHSGQSDSKSKSSRGKQRREDMVNRSSSESEKCVSIATYQSNSHDV